MDQKPHWHPRQREGRQAGPVHVNPRKGQRGPGDSNGGGAKSQGQRIQKKPAGGRRPRQRYRPTLVQKGPLGLHMDENEPGTTTFLVTLRRKGILPTVPVWTSLTGRRPRRVRMRNSPTRETRAHSVSTKLGRPRLTSLEGRWTRQGRGIFRISLPIFHLSNICMSVCFFLLCFSVFPFSLSTPFSVMRWDKAINCPWSLNPPGFPGGVP